jgi:hypothetical protein
MGFTAHLLDLSVKLWCADLIAFASVHPTIGVSSVGVGVPAAVLSGVDTALIDVGTGCDSILGVCETGLVLVRCGSRRAASLTAAGSALASLLGGLAASLLSRSGRLVDDSVFFSVRSP